MPYGFNVSINGSNLSFSQPSPYFLSASGSGTTSGALELNNSGDSYQYDAPLASQDALDAAFANGTYTLNFGPWLNLGLSLTGDAYPMDVPQLTGTVNGATWNSSGQLVINANTGDTLDFNTFGGYISELGGHMEFSIDSLSVDEQATYSPIFEKTDEPFATYTIAPGTLVPGQAYSAFLRFDSIVDSNTDGPADSVGAAVYGNEVRFTILAAIPEPMNDALGLGIGALLALLLFRRRRRRRAAA